MLVTHDIHTHTKLSLCCKDPAALPENYIKRAAELGLKTIGFSNHMWDSRMPGASNWYKQQDMDHILAIKDQIPADTAGVRVLIGCETEFCGGDKIGISYEAAEQLDYVLVPMSHFHMKGLVLPEGVTDLRDIARLLVQRFHEVLDLGIATGIAHPFLPLGFIDQVDTIHSYISDSEFVDCFGRAAEAKVSIEIHSGCLPGCQGKTKEGLHDETFLRMLSIAKQCGCFFHFGSDTHTLEGLDKVLGLEKAAQQLGIGEDDIMPLLRER